MLLDELPAKKVKPINRTLHVHVEAPTKLVEDFKTCVSQIDRTPTEILRYLMLRFVQECQGDHNPRQMRMHIK